MTDKGEIIPGLFCGAGDASICDVITGTMMDTIISGGSHFSLTMGYIAAMTATQEIA